MKIRFDSLAGPAAGKITMACNQLPTCVNASVTALSLLNTNWPAYRRWFDASGNANPAHVQFVRNVFTTVQRWLVSKTFTFVNLSGSPSDQPGIYAYVMAPGNHMRAGGGLGTKRFGGVDHVGSGVRIMLPSRTTTAIGELIKTIFHEITHKVGYNIDDIGADPYDPADCEDRAQHHPEQAIRNAENYTLFFTEINNL